MSVEYVEIRKLDTDLVDDGMLNAKREHGSPDQEDLDLGDGTERQT